VGSAVAMPAGDPADPNRAGFYSDVEGQYEGDGDQSMDPNGLAITYDWVLLSQPVGSVVTMPAGAAVDPNRPGFVPDEMGLYVPS